MKCWSCRKNNEDPFARKISFRSTCEFCDAALHCCCNCKFHQIGLPNECCVPNTDFVFDRKTSNFCEEFQLRLQDQTAKKVDPMQAFHQLFGED